MSFKSLLLTSLLGLALASTSCSDKKYCYECTTDRFYVTLPESDTTRIDTDNKVFCDHDDESIKDVERGGTSYITYERDGKLIQEHTKMTCRP